MKEEGLKPCPFCGGNVINLLIRKTKTGSEKGEFQCGTCGVVFSLPNENISNEYHTRFFNELIKKWNTRKKKTS